MRFRDLPRPAKVLVVGMCLLGMATLAWSFFLPAPRDTASAFILVALAFVVASKRVEIHPSVATIQLGFVFVFAALFRCGTAVAMAATIVNALGSYVLRPRDRAAPGLWATAYNTACLVASALAAGLAYEYLAPTPDAEFRLASVLPAALAAVSLYYAGTVVSVGLASTLSALKLPPRRWWTELAWLAPLYVAGGAVALAIHAAVHYFGHWVFVLGLPFAYVMHRSLVNQAGKLAEEVRRLEERAQASEGLAKLYRSVLQALANAIDAKDHGTHLHTERVQALTAAVARRLGLEGDDLEALDTAAILHDIGKLAIPDNVLLKPGRLAEHEFRLIQEHAAAGEAILKPIDFGSDVAAIVRHHHEKADGTGYPDGLSGEEIPLGARILAVVDVYDALVSERPYRRAWTSERAIQYLREQAGQSFDRRVVEALLHVLQSDGLGEHRSPPTSPLGARFGLPSSLAADADLLQAMPRHEAVALASRWMLAGVAEEFAGRGLLEACVAYEVNHARGELDAVAAAGRSAQYFTRIRMSLGVGASGEAAATGKPVYNAPATDDLAQFAEGGPSSLEQSTVTAFPILSSSGNVLGVLSFYVPASAPFAPALLAEADLATAVLGRQLELTSRPGARLPSSLAQPEVVAK